MKSDQSASAEITDDSPIAMRLTEENRRIIRTTTAEIFGPAATVKLFGSRRDDLGLGSDIDLIVELEQPNPEKARKSLQLIARLRRRLGDQPIDLLVVDPQTVRQPIHDSALRMGVPV